ncbi:MAG: O-antigen ligase family protein, partial [Minisyncoccales bacterium]
MKHSSLLLKIIKTGLFLIFVSPLVVGYQFFFPFVAPKGFWIMFFSQLMFFSWLILIFLFPQYRPKINFISLSVSLFIFSLLVSTIFSLAPSLSFWSNSERMSGFLFFLHLFVFFLVVSNVFKREELEMVFFFIVLIGIGIALFTFFIPGSREGGTLGNSSFWGTTMLFIIFFNIYLLLNWKKFRRFLIFSLIFLSFFLLINQARAAKVSVLLGFLLFFILYFSFVFPNKKIQKVSRLILFLSIIVSLVFIYFLFIPQSLPRKILEKATDASFGGRFIIWKVVWSHFFERPFFGFGLETLDLISFKNFNPCVLTPQCGGEMWYDRA